MKPDDERRRLELPPRQMGALGYRVVDLLVDHYRTVRDKPAWRKAGRPALEAVLREPPPEQGGDPQALLSLLEREVFPPIGNLLHPRFFGFIASPSHWISVLAELLASGYNPFAGNWMEASGPAAIEVITLCTINPRTTE